MKNEELKITNFCVADFPFTVHLPGGLEADRLLPSFRTFRMEGDAADLPDRLFDFIALPAAEMPATAEIVTDDLRLIERFIQPVKKIWKEGMSR